MQSLKCLLLARFGHWAFYSVALGLGLPWAWRWNLEAWTGCQGMRVRGWVPSWAAWSELRVAPGSRSNQLCERVCLTTEFMIRVADE